ncbi:MAG: hypothetical protein NVS4B12_12460 [Ktedonobacteraceae bacterium]
MVPCPSVDAIEPLYESDVSHPKTFVYDNEGVIHQTRTASQCLQSYSLKRRIDVFEIVIITGKFT